jgi:hypothetical protein
MGSFESRGATNSRCLVLSKLFQENRNTINFEMLSVFFRFNDWEVLSFSLSENEQSDNNTLNPDEIVLFIARLDFRGRIFMGSYYNAS